MTLTFLGLWCRSARPTSADVQHAGRDPDQLYRQLFGPLRQDQKKVLVQQIPPKLAPIAPIKKLIFTFLVSRHIGVKED